MIRAVRVKNFQSHKDSHLEFSPGLNVIVGKSDSGKSALIRAIVWVATNRPTGEAFRSRWGGRTEVEIVTDCSIIRRIRDKGVNEYQVNGRVFRAFGQGVPDEVREALNMDSSLNIQLQLDPPFLLSMTPGEAALYLSERLGLDLMNRLENRLRLLLRREEEKIGRLREEREEVQKAVKETEWTEEADRELNRILELKSSVGRTATRVQQLEDLIRKIQVLQEEIAGLERRLAFGDEVQTLLTQQEELQEEAERLRALEGAVARAEELSKELAEAEKILAFGEETEQLERETEEVQSLEEKAAGLERLMRRMRRVKREEREAEERVRRLQEEFNRLMPDICPLCGQEVRKCYC